MFLCELFSACCSPLGLVRQSLILVRFLSPFSWWQSWLTTNLPRQCYCQAPVRRWLDSLPFWQLCSQSLIVKPDLIESHNYFWSRNSFNIAMKLKRDYIYWKPKASMVYVHRWTCIRSPFFATILWQCSNLIGIVFEVHVLFTNPSIFSFSSLWKKFPVYEWAMFIKAGSADHYLYSNGG